MKIAIIGAAGVRTPLIVKAMIKRQEQLGLKELALMDIDGDRLELIGALTAQLEHGGYTNFQIQRTTDPRQALSGADFVILTFRVGGIESRVIDEQVPLALGTLGQETTGPGGFAMAMRSIPVLLDYIGLMKTACPDAWLINFSNPAGMMAEAAVEVGNWERTVGICDAPSQMQRVAAAAIGMLTNQAVQSSEVYLDYFGLNHLGWTRSVRYRGKDYLPELLALIQAAGGIPGLPFDPAFLTALGMIPNEYLYYYYYAIQAVQKIRQAGTSRAQQIVALNQELFADLRRLKDENRLNEMHTRYYAYLDQRGATYMNTETGLAHDLSQLDPRLAEAMGGEGYAGVALDLIEGLVSGAQPRPMILNIPNRGAVTGMAAGDVVEIPALVDHGLVQPLVVGEVPEIALGLMKQVKAYERLTIAAAAEGSYANALLALTIHPLVADQQRASEILAGYREKHGSAFPALA